MTAWSFNGAEGVADVRGWAYDDEVLAVQVCDSLGGPAHLTQDQVIDLIGELLKAICRHKPGP